MTTRNQLVCAYCGFAWMAAFVLGWPEEPDGVAALRDKLAAVSAEVERLSARG